MHVLWQNKASDAACPDPSCLLPQFQSTVLAEGEVMFFSILWTFGMSYTLLPQDSST